MTQLSQALRISESLEHCRAFLKGSELEERRGMASRRGAEGSRRVAFRMAVLHSGAEDAEARSLRFALRDWGRRGRWGAISELDRMDG